MKKLAKFLVEKRLWLFVGSIIVALVSLVLMNFVKVNQDMTQYLPKDSNMRLGLEIMDREFPAVESNEQIKLMFKNLTYKQKQLVKVKIEAYPGVQSVAFELESDSYNSGEYTLYVVTSEYNNLDQVTVLAESMLDHFDNNYTVYAYYGNPMYNVLDVLLPLAMGIFLVALVVFCKAYIEVFLLLVSIGFSILINMGTNIIFPSISDMTLSIAAVLQLALSIDYSIMLFHRYEQEKIRLAERPNNVLAMKRAIRNAFSSVSSSAVTTIVGLLVLLLMSFTIGADMGLVMAKGIFCSLICVFTVMPTLVLWCDKLLVTTNKKYLREQRLLKKSTQELDEEEDEEEEEIEEEIKKEGEENYA